MKLYCQLCDIDQTIDESEQDTPSCANCGRRLSSKDEFATAGTGTNAADFDQLETRDFDYPQRIGNYRIISHVATGGFGTVYKAFDGALERHIAIKVPRADRLTSASANAFVEEGKTIAKLEHGHIVSVYEAGRDPYGNVFIAMQWVEGCTLAQYSKKNNLGCAKSIQIIEQVASALQFAHDKGFVHRDLKPSNILINSEGDAFVTDFGLALHENELRHSKFQIAGTLAYMSPEQIRGDMNCINGRSDIWSLGVIFFELLSGRRPFRGNSDEVKSKILDDNPMQKRQFVAQMPRQLAAICGRCLEKEQSKRYHKCIELLADLDQASQPNRYLAKLAFAGGLGLAVAVIWIIVIFLTDPGGIKLPYVGSNPDTKENTKGYVSLENGEIRPLFWIEDAAEMTVKQGTLSVSSIDQRALLMFGSIGDGDHKIKVDLAQQTWTGNIGFVFGFDENRYQIIFLERDPIDRTKLSLMRCHQKFDEQYCYREPRDVIRMSIGSISNASRTLELNFVNGDLKGGKFGSISLDPLTQNTPFAKSEGQFGIYVSNSKVTLRNLTIDEVSYEFRKK